MEAIIILVSALFITAIIFNIKNRRLDKQIKAKQQKLYRDQVKNENFIVQNFIHYQNGKIQMPKK